MKFSRNLCRIILCLVLIFSGFVKLIDPVGTSLKLQEYFAAAHISFLDFASLYLAIALATVEFTLGICLLMYVRMKLVSRIALYLMCFFTIVSLLLWIFNPIEDCGCFGEAVHLTNLQTFIKNIVLLFCAYVVFLQGEKFDRITNNVLEWVFLGSFAALSVGTTILSYLYTPNIDFTDYKLGTSLIQDNSQEPYTSTFIYELDGVKQEFDIEHLPDDSWTYVDTKTVENPEYIVAPDFSVTTGIGSDLTEYILQQDNVVVMSIYYPDNYDNWEVAKKFGLYVIDNGGMFIVLASKKPEGVPSDFPFPIYFADIKTLITMNRSNGGSTLIKNGIISKKLSSTEMSNPKPMADILQEDEDILVIKSKIRARLNTLGSIFLLIIVLYLMKNICRLTYRHRD